MVATFALAPIASMPIEPNHITPGKQLGWSKPSNPRSGLNFKASVQAPSYVKGNSFRNLTNQISNLSLFFSTEKPSKRNSDIFEEFGISGKFLENGLVFCQDFSIRSYEVGADGTISLETLISHLQVLNSSILLTVRTKFMYSNRALIFLLKII